MGLLINRSKQMIIIKVHCKKIKLSDTTLVIFSTNVTKSKVIPIILFIILSEFTSKNNVTLANKMIIKIDIILYFLSNETFK